MHNRYFFSLKTDVQVRLRRFLLPTALCFLTSAGLKAQFSSGNSFFVREGTIVSINGLNLKPTLDLDFSNQQVQKSTTPATTADPGSLGSIAAVYELSHPVSFKGELGIRYTDDALNGNTPALLALAYHNGTSGFSITNILTLSNNDHLVWGATGINTINLVKLTAVNTGVLLPIKLLYFRGQPLSGSILLSWSTAHELGNDHFEIERSADGKAFALLSKTPSKGDATMTQDYRLSDDHPMNGPNYYRLKQISQDGTFSYADVISVLFNQNSDTRINIYPNPASHILHVNLNWSLPQVSVITIFSASGRPVMQVKTLKQSQGLTELNVANLAAGVYYLKVEGSAGSYSKPFSIIK